MWWVISLVIIIALIFTYSILKAASDVDDQILGDSQYEETH